VTSIDIDTSVPALVLKLYHGGLAVTRTLGRLGVEVHGVAESRRRPGTASRYLRGVHIWDLDATPPSESVERLLELGHSIGNRPLLIPTEDVGALLLADNAERLREAFRFPEQPAGLARRLSSKEGMRMLCAEHGIPTPAATSPRSRDDVEAFVASTTFPVVLKGLDGGRFERLADARVVVAETADELWRVWARLDPEDPDVLIQEYIPGGPESVWMFNGYFDRDSRCLLGITGQKLRQYPPYTGFTSLGICRDNAAVRETTCAFMAKLGYRGVLDLGYRLDVRDGTYKLLDVNPRVGSTFRLFVGRNGLDVVRALYLDLTGQTVEPDEAVPGRKWLIENLDLASSATYFRNGELLPIEWLRSFHGVAETAWFARDDPKPFLAMVRESFRGAAGAVGPRLGYSKRTPRAASASS
jgi:predicted ATP-grasp superfamily ATP-dependent carboligase